MKYAQGARMLPRRFKKVALSSALVLAGAAVSVNGYAASATANGTATVIQPVAIAKNVDLDFGAIASPSSAGTVVVAASSSGTRSVTNGVVLVNTDTGSAAKFTVTGESGTSYTLTLPSAAATITHTVDNTKTMTIDTWTSSLAALDGGSLASGTEVVYVGGTLNMGAAQTAGSYSGSFSVSVEYN